MSILSGLGDRIRTCDLLLPKQALYQAELRPESPQSHREGRRAADLRSATGAAVRAVAGRGLCAAIAGHASGAVAGTATSASDLAVAVALRSISHTRIVAKYGRGLLLFAVRLLQVAKPSTSEPSAVRRDGCRHPYALMNRGLLSGRHCDHLAIKVRSSSVRLDPAPAPHAETKAHRVIAPDQWETIAHLGWDSNPDHPGLPGVLPLTPPRRSRWYLRDRGLTVRERPVQPDLEPSGGIEPPQPGDQFRLSNRRSKGVCTASPRQESNPEPAAYKAAALPN